MSLTFKEMQEMYKGVVSRFNKIELQDWKAEGAIQEGKILLPNLYMVNLDIQMIMNSIYQSE